jgi:hypothetical protein
MNICNWCAVVGVNKLIYKIHVVSSPSNTLGESVSLVDAELVDSTTELWRSKQFNNNSKR